MMASHTASEELQIPTAFQGLLVGEFVPGERQLPLEWPTRERHSVAATTFLSVREVAVRLGVHENTVRNWIEKGILRAARLPTSGYRRIPATEVNRVQRDIYGNLAAMTTGPVVELPDGMNIDIIHHDQTS
jgi:excisionase family DNA binding protein